MGIIVHPYQPNIPTVPGVDYTTVSGQQLPFPRGTRRVCHIVDILQDELCEDNENFFSILLLVSGEQPIMIDPPTAQVVIDDSHETECSKYD